MVIRGKARGNWKQLRDYLLNQGENDHIRVLEVSGTASQDFRQGMKEVSYVEELTRGHNYLYHAQINPGVGEDKMMSDEKWKRAGQILAEETGLENQPRFLVLHEKKGRIHCHAVFSRYDIETEKLISDSYSFYNHDAARQRMEKEFEHKRTRLRVPKLEKDNLTQALTDAWNKAKSPEGFIQGVKKQGYQVVTSDNRRPYMVVSQEGRSFDLVRHLKDVKTKEVRERFKGVKLPTDRQIIDDIRKKTTAEKFSENRFTEPPPVQVEDDRDRRKREFKERMKRNLTRDKDDLEI